jgi:DNA-binding MarR family transcriptional regulator
MSRDKREGVNKQNTLAEPPSIKDRDGHPGHEQSAAQAETLHACLRKLVQLMPQVSRGLRRRQIPPVVVSDAGLGRRHGAALSLLHEQGPMTVGCLAAQLGLTLATVSGIIADIERAEFVVRSADPADRRRTIVTLAQGRSEAVGAWLEGASAPLQRALDKLTPEEQATFVKAMTVLEAELNSDSDDQPSSVR